MFFSTFCDAGFVPDFGYGGPSLWKNCGPHDIILKNIFSIEYRGEKIYDTDLKNLLIIGPNTTGFRTRKCEHILKGPSTSTK